jgi:membrane glycosyltransferase
MKPIVLGSVVLMFVTALKAMAPNFLQFLPLGGSVIAETGIILSFAVSFATLKEAFWDRK